MSKRPSRDQILMVTALTFSQRGTCPRLQVGAVASRDGRILVTGYNGAPAGLSHCTHKEWLADRDGPEVPGWVRLSFARLFHTPDSEAQKAELMDWYDDNGQITAHSKGQPSGRSRATCNRAVHAEANVVAFGARIPGVSLVDSTVHVTHMPCVSCAMLLVNAGVSRVVYFQPYRITAGVELLQQARVEVTQYTPF